MTKDFIIIHPILSFTKNPRIRFERRTTEIWRNKMQEYRDTNDKNRILFQSNWREQRQNTHIHETTWKSSSSVSVIGEVLGRFRSDFGITLRRFWSVSGKTLAEFLMGIWDDYEEGCDNFRDESTTILSRFRGYCKIRWRRKTEIEWIWLILNKSIESSESTDLTNLSLFFKLCVSSTQNYEVFFCTVYVIMIIDSISFISPETTDEGVTSDMIT